MNLNEALLSPEVRGVIAAQAREAVSDLSLTEVTVSPRLGPGGGTQRQRTAAMIDEAHGVTPARRARLNRLHAEAHAATDRLGVGSTRLRETPTPVTPLRHPCMDAPAVEVSGIPLTESAPAAAGMPGAASTPEPAWAARMRSKGMQPEVIKALGWPR